MRKRRIKKFRLDLAKHCFVSRGKLNTLLANSYGRDEDKVCLKIFDQTEVNNVEDYETALWGDNPPQGEPRKNTTLFEGTQIQNILAWHGLAPRVYGLETVNLCDKLVPLQVTEYVEGEDSTIDEAVKVYNKVKKLGEEYGFKVEKDDVSEADVIGGKLVDVQTFAFNWKYMDTAKDIYINKGKYGKVYYQDIPAFKLSGGPRKSEERIKMLGLDKIDFNGKTVLDIGCAGGFFCRYAVDRGAKKVTGMDLPETAEAAFHASNYLGYFNIDYLPVDVREIKTSYDEFDIVLLLSMNYHIGIPDWIPASAKEVMVFEDNGKGRRNLREVADPWVKQFNTQEFIGLATDHGDKPIYHIKK